MRDRGASIVPLMHLSFTVYVVKRGGREREGGGGALSPLN